MQPKVNSLSPGELERYDRQLRIPTFSHEIQQKLKRSKVAILGMGGTGCPCALYLTAVGVGAGIVGLFQATDVIKYLTSIGETFPGQRILIDLLDFTVYHLEQERRKGCPHCGLAAESSP